VSASTQKRTSWVGFDPPGIPLGAGKSTGAVLTAVESIRLGLVYLAPGHIFFALYETTTGGRSGKDVNSSLHRPWPSGNQGRAAVRPHFRPGENAAPY